MTCCYRYDHRRTCLFQELIWDTNVSGRGGGGGGGGRGHFFVNGGVREVAVPAVVASRSSGVESSSSSAAKQPSGADAAITLPSQSMLLQRQRELMLLQRQRALQMQLLSQVSRDTTSNNHTSVRVHTVQFLVLIFLFLFF